jgi:hypothetical protein
MHYPDVVQFFSPSMKQDEMIEVLTEELYSNNYKLMEQIIEEYVTSMDGEQLNHLECFINANLTD